MTTSRTGSGRRVASLIVVLMMCFGALLGFVNQATAHTCIEMGSLSADGSIAYGINQFGQIVGDSLDGSGGSNGFVVNPRDTNGDGTPDIWTADLDGDGVNDLMHDLGSLSTNTMANDTEAFAINDNGHVAGYSHTTAGATRAFLIDPICTDLDGVPDTWNLDSDADNANDLMIDLGALHPSYPSADVYGRDVNNNDLVVGQSVLWSGVWQAGEGWHNLGSMGGWQTEAWAINDNGVVVGATETPDDVQHAFVITPVLSLDGTYSWNEDTDYDGVNELMEDLGTFGGPMGMCVAKDVNNAGVIVGYGYDFSVIPTVAHALKWVEVSGAWQRTDLTTDPAVLWGEGRAYGINDAGSIVGISPDAYCHAFVFEAGQMHELDTSFAAYGINDHGQIVGASSNGKATIWLPGAAPTAAFTTSVSGLTVSFDGSASSDYDGTIVSYAWDFGDYKIGSGASVAHEYWIAGTYTVTLTVTDDTGKVGSLSMSVSVDLPPAQTPEAALVDLLLMIPDCHDAYGNPIDPAVEESLMLKAEVALQIIGARKSGGDPTALDARKSGGANLLVVFDSLVESYTLTGQLAGDDGWAMTCQSNLIISLVANQVRIAGVPNFQWYNGCGPTAAGMLIAYWDAHGYDGLVNGESELLQTPEINAMIASEGHIADYALVPDATGRTDDSTGDLIPDKSETGGAHEDDCLADYMHTSWSAEPYKLGYGLTWASMVPIGLEEYTMNAPRITQSIAQYVGYSKELPGASFSWEDLRFQVDSAHPMIATVDYNADGDTDHLVTIVGYCQIASARLYAFHSTWDNSVYWGTFEMMKKGVCYGIFSGFTYDIVDLAQAPV